MKQAYKLLTILLFFFVCVSNGNAQTLSKGSGTETDPYLIESESDWNTFASDVNGGYPYSGKYVKLVADISVSTMVGASTHPYEVGVIKPFAGTFDGNGKTLVIDIKDVEDAYIAPFRFLDGATIKNIKVTGTVDAATYKQGASLVGRTTGTVNLINCHCSATIQGGATDNGYGSHGGIVGESNGWISFNNCVFDGKIDAPEVHSCGGFIGWITSNSWAVTFENCLMAGTVNCKTTNTGTFYCTRSYSGTLTDCYYVESIGEEQGTKAFAAPAETGFSKTITFYDDQACYCHGTSSFDITELKATDDNNVSLAYTVKYDGTTLTKGTDYEEIITDGDGNIVDEITPLGKYTLTVKGKVTDNNGYYGTYETELSQPYAIFSSDGKTLTFKYGAKPDGAFDLYNDEGNPGWSNEIEVETVTKVVFDDSFKDARPTSCYFWFGSVPYITEIVGMKENLNTSEVTGMTGMFAGCSNLTTIDLSGFNTKNVTSMYDMFWYCTSLTTLDLSSFNTENVTNMEGMFENCTNLTSLNLSGLDTKHVTSMNNMFLGCENLTTIIVGDNWSTANVTNGDDMFNYCNSLVGGNGTTYDANHIDKTYAIIDGKNGNPGYLTIEGTPFVVLSDDGTILTFKYGEKPDGAYSLSSVGWKQNTNITKVVFDETFQYARPTQCSEWFYGLSNLSEIVGMKEYLNTEKVTTMNWMFRDCKKITALDLSGFKTDIVTKMGAMFYGCEKLTTLDLSNFKTDNVTDMESMFENCSGLTNLNLNRFNTGNVTDMERMFNSCSNLNVLDISSFNTENVTNMEYMFFASAETILIGENWNTEQVTKSDHMFTNCLSLIGNYGLWGAQLETLYDKTYAHANKGGLLTTGKYKIFYLLDNDLQKYYTDENSELKFETFTNSVNEFGGSEVTLVNPEKDNAYFDYWVDLLEYNRSLLGGTAPNHLPTITLSANDVGNRIYIAFWIYPYAVLSEDKKTLTFYFDKEKDSKVGTKYDLNDGETTPAWSSEAENITKVIFDESFKDARPTSCFEWFYDMTNLTEIVGMKDNINTSDVTNMMDMFYGCEKLTTLDLSNFNTENVTDMTHMFSHCEKLTAIKVGSGWDANGVTSHNYMFSACIALIGNEGVWVSSTNKTNANTLSTGYLTSDNYKVFLDPDGGTLTGGNVINVTSEVTLPEPTKSGHQFLGWVRQLTSATYESSTSTNVTVAENDGNRWYKAHWAVMKPYVVLSDDSKTLTFKCGESIPDGAYTPLLWSKWSSNNQTVTKVVFEESFQYARPTNCIQWFQGFNKLETITGLQYLNTEEVTNMQMMFYGCTNLKTLDLSNFNTEKVKDMQFMFYGCENLNVLDIRNFDTKIVEKMTDMFTSCSNLKTILVSDKWSVESVTASDGMFRYCSDLIGNYGARVSTVDYTHANANADGYLTKDDYKIFYKWADDKTGAYQTQYTPSTFNGATAVTINNPDDREYPFLYWTQVSANGTQIGESSTNLTISAGDLGNKIYVMHWRVPQPYAELSSDNKTLTFKYGDKPDGAYELYDGETTNPGWYDNRKNITKVVFDASFAEARPTSCYCWFKEFENLKEFVGIENFNTSEVTTMRSMFDKCRNLESIDLSHFDTRNLKSMRSMFYDCIKLITLDLSSFNTDLVETMQFTFTNCSTLTRVNIRNFNPKNVENMSGMFSECKQLTTILVGQDWTQENISSVTSSQNMFVNCNEIIGNDGTTYDATKVDKTNAHADAGGYLTKDDYKIFYKWADDETGAYQAYTPSTFSGTTNVTIDNPTREGYKFLYWTRVSASGEQIGSSSATLEIAAGEVGNRIYKMHWAVPYAVISENSTGKTLTFKYDADKPETGAYDLNEGETIPAWSHDAENIIKVIFDESFKDARPTSCYYWFDNMTNLTEIVGMKEYLNTSEVTNMEDMFAWCSKLTTIDVSGFNTEKVNNINWMFRDCENLTSLDLSGFKTDIVTDMSAMFFNCQKLTTLDLSAFNTKNVESMEFMFAGCSNLTTILISEKWKADEVETDRYMFNNCPELIGNDGSTVGETVDKTYAHAGESGYLTSGDYKIFYQWADENPKTYHAHTPSTFSGAAAVSINNPEREGYNFEYWTRVSASGTQIGESSANLIIAAGDIGNRIYQMNWAVDVTAIADTRFRGKPSGNLDEIHICGSEFQMSANETTISGVEGRWTLGDNSSAEDYIAASDIHNPSATVKNIPNTGVTLKWTITDGTNSGSDEITIYNEKAEIPDFVPMYACNGSVTLSGYIPSADAENYAGVWSTDAPGSFNSDIVEQTTSEVRPTFQGIPNGYSAIFTWSLVHKVSVTDGERTYDECASDDQIVYVTNHQIEAKIGYPDKKNKLICVDNFDGLLANDVSIYDDGTNIIKGWWTSDNDAVIKYEARYEGISNSAYAVNVSYLPHGETVFTWHVEGFGCGEVTETVTINNGAVTADAGEDDFTCTDEYELHASELEEGWTGYWLIIGGSFENFVNSTNNVTKVTGLSEYIANTFQWHVKTADYYGQEGCSDYDDVKITANGFTVYADWLKEEKNSQYSNCGQEGTVYGIPPTGEWTGEWTSSPVGLIVGASTTNTVKFDLGSNESAVLKWTVTENGCTDFDEVTVTNIKPKAETEQPVYYACGEDPVTLSGILPENTTGEWSKSFSAAEGAFVGATDISNAQYSFPSNGLMVSTELLEWTVKSIEDPYCYTSTTVAVINNRYEPTITASNYICGTETSIEGTIPESGFNGYWICTSSTLVTFDESTNKQTTVKKLQPGENTIQWTVYNAEGERCNSVSEEYVIENIKVVPTVADVDPTFDGTFTVALSASSLSDYGIVGSDIFGRWETVSAPVTVNILNSTNNETEVSGLTETGDYEFKWVVYRKIDGFPEETGYSDGGFCHDSKTVSFKYEVMKLLVDASGFEYGLPVYPKVTTIQGLDVTDDCEKLYTDENGQPVLTDLALTPVGKYTLKASYLGVTSSTTFNISPRHVTPEITLSQTEVVYDGGEKTPEIISVAFDGIDLLDECSEPLYQNNRNVGMATVTITNKSGSNYTFSKSVNFFINAIPFEYLVGKRAVVKIPVSTTGLNFSSDNKEISVVFRDGGYCVTTSKNVKKGDIAHIKSTIVDIVVTVADPFENFFDDSKWYNTDIALKTPENSNGWILSLPDYTDNIVTQEGENDVKCQILDDEENIIAEESYLIKIDKTAPEIFVLADGHGLENSKHYFLRSGAEFSAAAKDNFSGVETLEYSWDNEIFKQYDEKITLPYGKSSVYVRSKDVAGNQTETLKADFSVFEDSKFALNNSDEITSDTIFYSSKNISDMSFEINLNGNTIGSVTDASGNSFNFSDNVITVKKEYLETLSPGISPLYVRINPLGEKSAWDGGNPADFESETMTINLDVKYIVTIDKRYDFALLTDPDVKIFCPGDNVVMSFDFDEDCSSADFITVKLLGIEKETPDGGINFQVPFDGLRGGKESLAIEFYKDGYVFEDSVVFSANYPSERTFRVYDDVLALDNFDRQFVDSCYKWYIDNKEIDSANAQFLDLTKVIFDNEQHVFTVSVLDKDGNRFRVCPDEDFVVTPSVSKRQAAKVKTYPNPAVSRHPVYIELKNFAEEDFSDSEIWIYNQLGGLVQKVSEVGERTAVVLPSGFYSGVVVVRGQKVLNFKIVVE